MKVFFTIIKLKNWKMRVGKFSREITNVQCKNLCESRNDHNFRQQNSVDGYYSRWCTIASSYAIKHDTFLKNYEEIDHVSPIL